MEILDFIDDLRFRFLLNPWVLWQCAESSLKSQILKSRSEKNPASLELNYIQYAKIRPSIYSKFATLTTKKQKNSILGQNVAVMTR